MVAGKHVSEAEKRRRVPGIEFVNGPAGRRAHVIGALDVWEVIQEYKADGNDRARLAAVYDWLTAAQIDAALAYYAAFPDEIDERLAAEAAITPETFGEIFPELRPAQR